MNKYEEILNREIEILKDKLSDEEQAEWVHVDYVNELDTEIEELEEIKNKLETLEKAETACGKSLDKIVEEYLQMKKVIEILKFKSVDIYNLQFCIGERRNPLESYNTYIKIVTSDDSVVLDNLTEEEFNLLKEVFE